MKFSISRKDTILLALKHFSSFKVFELYREPSFVLLGFSNLENDLCSGRIVSFQHSIHFRYLGGLEYIWEAWSIFEYCKIKHFRYTWCPNIHMGWELCDDVCIVFDSCGFFFMNTVIAVFQFKHLISHKNHFIKFPC